MNREQYLKLTENRPSGRPLWGSHGIMTQREYEVVAHALLNETECQLESVFAQSVPGKGIVLMNLRTENGDVAHDLAACRLLKENWPYDYIAVTVVVKFKPQGSVT